MISEWIFFCIWSAFFCSFAPSGMTFAITPQKKGWGASQSPYIYTISLPRPFVQLEYFLFVLFFLFFIFLKRIVVLTHYLGSTRISMTESPRKNIFEIKRSLLIGLDFAFPFPAFGCSVHISFTFSKTCPNTMQLWYLQLLQYVLQKSKVVFFEHTTHHVAVTIKSLDSPEKFPVVTNIDKDLKNTNTFANTLFKLYRRIDYD